MKTMKECGKCKFLKEENCFNLKKGKLQSYCIDCNKKYQREHYQNNKNNYKSKSKQYNKVHRQNIQQKLWNYYLNNPCVDCNESNPIVLESDHIHSGKTDNISNLVGKGFSWTRIEKELKLCVTRCANCHRKRTVIQLGWYKNLFQ